MSFECCSLIWPHVNERPPPKKKKNKKKKHVNKNVEKQNKWSGDVVVA